MTVTTDTRSITYDGDGSTTAFPVSYYFLEAADLTVTLVDASGVDHVQTITTDYTVSGAGDENGGTVTMLTAPVAGEKLRIERLVDILQPTNYPENTKFPAASHERALDRLTMIDQQQQGEINRAPKFSETSGVTDVTIEQGTEGQILVYDEDGNIVPRDGVDIGAAAFASQSEAEAGTSDSLLMSPLRTKQSIAVEVGDTIQAHDSNLDTLSSGTTTLGTTGLELLAAETEEEARADIALDKFQQLVAAGDGVTDDTAQVEAWQTKDGLLLAPNGDYSIPGNLTSPTRPRIVIADDAQENGTNVPFISIGKEPFKSLPKNFLFIQQDTSDRADNVTFQLQRLVNTDDGLANPKALRVVTNVNVDTAQTEWAISGELNNYSNTASTGNTATSGVANKYGTASVFGGHFQAKDWNIFAAATDVTALVGTEINTPAVGLDHPSANGGYGNRIVLDVIARTNEQVEDWDSAGGNDGDAEIGVGIRVRSDNLTNGTYRFGIAVLDGNAPISTGIRVNTAGIYGIHVTGANTGAQIYAAGAAQNGIIIAGTYTGVGLRLNDGIWLGLSTDNSRKIRWSAGTDAIEFWNGASERFAVRMNASPIIELNGVQLLKTRETGWVSPSGAAQKGTFTTSTVTIENLAQNVKGIVDALLAHGLIGA